MRKMTLLGVIFILTACAPRWPGTYELAQNTGYHCYHCSANSQTQLDFDRNGCIYQLNQMGAMAAPGVVLPPIQDTLDNCMAAKGWQRVY